MANEPKITAPPPRANPRLIGHGSARVVFARAIASGRLPHGWLLTGPRGIGKATFAWRMARALLAGLPDDGAGAFELPPEHPVFRRVVAGGHPDVRGIERTLDDRGRPRTVIRVEDVRAIAEFLSLTPAEGKHRIVIVDAAEELNEAAANAVLKWLEEPPAQTLILLVSHAPHRVLRTIRSRCCRLAFAPLANAEAATVLEMVGGVPPAEAATLAALSGGRPGRAIAMQTEGGIGLHAELMSILETLPALDWGRVHLLADRVSARAGDAAYHLLVDLLSDWIARTARLAAGGQVQVAAEEPLAMRLGAGADLARLAEVWEKVTGLVARAERINLDRKQVVLAIFGAVRGALAR